jgi:hypothetical protein
MDWTRISADRLLLLHDTVLMGRGGKNNQHVGNETFRKVSHFGGVQSVDIIILTRLLTNVVIRNRPDMKLARLEALEYSTAGKKVKSNIAKGLVMKVRQMQPPGRFLKRNPITSEWEGKVTALQSFPCYE